MSKQTSTEPKVLACIDGAAFSEAVCDYALWMSRRIGAPLKFLHTIEHQPVPPVADMSGAIGLGSSEELLNELTEVEQRRSSLRIKKGKLMLEGARARAAEQGVDEVECRQRHGTLAEALVELEDEIRVLTVGIRGEQHESNADGIGHQLESIIRSLHKPILVVNQSFAEPERIMLAYDGSDAARKALRMVCDSILFKETTCHLVHVQQEKLGGDPILEDGLKQLRDAGIEATAQTLDGRIDKVLIDYQAQHNIDLTIMGAFSHNRVRDFLLGSFTAKMLKGTQKPLLLLR